MSEYQYYEFQAIDRPLDGAAQAALRAISTRARISATSFVNIYEWGDLKADPRALLERYFDLFLYLANWGSRRLAIKLPRSLFDVEAVTRFQLGEEETAIKDDGNHIIIDISRDEIEVEGWEDGGGRLAAMAPLRADLLAGDLRLFVLLWLMQVENDRIADDMEMPARLGPLSGALAAFADFMAIDPDLVAAAAEVAAPDDAPTADEVARFLAALSEDEKLDWLSRLHEGADPNLSAALRRRCRDTIGKGDRSPQQGLPTAGQLRATAERLCGERLQAAAEKAAAERRRQEEERAKAREARLVALQRRGESVWREVENEIDLRNASGYERAIALLADLGEIATRRGTRAEYDRRLTDIRSRHERKGKLIERLDALMRLRAAG